MAKSIKENLILVDFLVDEILPTDDTNKKLNLMEGEANVIFQFLDNEEVVLTKNDLEPRSGDEPFRNGKSLLFPISPDEGRMALKNFVINLKLIRKFKPGTLPDCVTIGDGKLHINELFRDLMNCALNSSEEAWVKCLRDSVKLYNDRTWVASLVCVVRMSCFGKFIIRPCQMHIGDIFYNHNLASLSPATTVCVPLKSTLSQTTANSNNSKYSSENQSNGEPENQIICPSYHFSNTSVFDKAFNFYNSQSLLASSKSMAPKYPNNKRRLKASESLQLIHCPNCTPRSISSATSLRISTEPANGGINKSQDKVVLHVKHGRFQEEPIKFEIKTPKVNFPVGAKKKTKTECKEQQYEYSDFPTNYLLDYYGKEKLYNILMEQVKHEEEIEADHGVCPIGVLGRSKRGEGGLKGLLFSLFGASELLIKEPDETGKESEMISGNPKLLIRKSKLSKQRKGLKSSKSTIFMDSRRKSTIYHTNCTTNCPIVKEICNAC